MTDQPTATPKPDAPVDHFSALDADLVSALHSVLDDAMSDIHHGTDGWDADQRDHIAQLNSMMWDSAKAKRLWWAR